MPRLTRVLEFTRVAHAEDPFAFCFTAQQYLLRADGGVFRTVTIPWDQALLADLSALRRSPRDPAVTQRVGELLRRCLEPAGWSALEDQLLQLAPEAPPVTLVVRAAAAELYALPWELLALRRTGQHLGELAHVLVRYEWPTDSQVAQVAQVVQVAPVAPAAPHPPPGEGGRLLLAWSAAGGAVPAAAHAALLAEICQRAAVPFAPEREILPRASCGRLVAALTAAEKSGAPVTILHLLCHGGQVGSAFGLWLDADEAEPLADGTSSPVCLDPERLRQLLAPFAQSLRLVVLAACDSGNDGALGNQLGSLAQVLHRLGIAAVVGSRFPLSMGGSLRLGRALYEALLVDTASLPSALSRVRQHLAEDVTSLDWASVQLYAGPVGGDAEFRPLVFRPYRGLLTFQPEHRRYLFGREPEIQEIQHKLDTLIATGKPRLLMVLGASGTGKSSLVLAGSVPRLLAKQDSYVDPGAPRPLQLHLLRPDGDALAQLRAVAADSRAPADRTATLLVIDQFEELFTHLDSVVLRQQLVQQLWQLATDPATSDVVLITMRIDYVGRCGELLVGADGLRLDAVAYSDPHRVLLAQMGTAALRAAVVEPARLLGLTIEEGLVTRILDDMAGEPGALPLLEDTLDLLWQRRRDGILTAAAYDEVGGIGGALQRRADAIFEALSASEQHAARSLLVRLVNVADDVALSTRRRLPRQSLLPDSPQSRAELEQILDKFVAARLLVCDSDGHGPGLATATAQAQAIEVAHEALIRKWPRLKEWVLADRQRLWELAQVELQLVRWRNYRHMLTGAELDFALRVAKEAGEALSKEARAMVRLFSLRRRRYLLLVTLPAVLVLATLLFDALTPLPLAPRLRIAQDVLIATCLLALLSFSTVGFFWFRPPGGPARGAKVTPGFR